MARAAQGTADDKVREAIDIQGIQPFAQPGRVLIGLVPRLTRWIGRQGRHPHAVVVDQAQLESVGSVARNEQDVTVLQVGMGDPGIP